MVTQQQRREFHLSPIRITLPTTGIKATYSVSYLGLQNPLATGHKLGILFKCVSPDSNAWINIDNVQLTNGDPTIIGVTNYSFEMPDSGKIKGWNGPGSCNDTSWTGNKTDIQAGVPIRRSMIRVLKPKARAIPRKDNIQDI